MMGKKLGQLKKIDVKDLWSNEAHDFTPWLAKEENITLLGKAIGIELEVENTEVPVGPYSADILAKDITTSNNVVIENQFGKTDHDHLGKAITYAAILNASSVVWIATCFTEEHRKSIEWLNDYTTEELGFYAVQLELWQIDDSLPAVVFDVISRPSTIPSPLPPNSEIRKLQLEFWTELRNALEEKKVAPSLQKPKPQYWYNVAVGKAGIVISNIADTYGNKIGVRIAISNNLADIALPLFLDQKEQIEAEVGQSLVWNPSPENKNKLIALNREADIRNRLKWPEYIEWMVEANKRFRASFGARARSIKPQSENQANPL